MFTIDDIKDILANDIEESIGSKRNYPGVYSVIKFEKKIGFNTFYWKRKIVCITLVTSSSFSITRNWIQHDRRKLDLQESILIETHLLYWGSDTFL